MFTPVNSRRHEQQEQRPHSLLDCHDKGHPTPMSKKESERGGGRRGGDVEFDG